MPFQKNHTINNGRTLSSEHKRELSLSMKGNRNALGAKRSSEFKEVHRKLMLGNTYRLGQKATEETKQKLRLASSQRLVAPNTGKTFSKEWKEHIAEGKLAGIERRENEENKFFRDAKGNLLPDFDERIKVWEAIHPPKTINPEGRANMSKALLGNRYRAGKPASKRTKENISIAMRDFWDSAEGQKARELISAKKTLWWQKKKLNEVCNS